MNCKGSLHHINGRYKELLCISAQIFQTDAGGWRELTNDFVLLHIYYDTVMRLTKLIALDGIKLIIKDLALSPCLTLKRPTKKFVHFVSSVYGRSEMYGFGLRKVEDVALFMNQVNCLNKKLCQIVTSNEKRDVSQLLVPTKNFPLATLAAPISFASRSFNVEHSSDSIWQSSSGIISPPTPQRNESALETAFGEISLSDDDFTETAVPSVLGALDDVYRTPTKQYMKELREN